MCSEFSCQKELPFELSWAPGLPFEQHLNELALVPHRTRGFFQLVSPCFIVLFRMCKSKETRFVQSCSISNLTTSRVNCSLAALWTSMVMSRSQIRRIPNHQLKISNWMKQLEKTNKKDRRSVKMCYRVRSMMIYVCTLVTQSPVYGPTSYLQLVLRKGPCE